MARRAKFAVPPVDGIDLDYRCPLPSDADH
jgi:hypothetical protein